MAPRGDKPSIGDGSVSRNFVTASAPQRIGAGVAYSVNDGGQVAGLDNGGHAFRWDASSGTLLAFAFGGSHPAVHPKYGAFVAGHTLRLPSGATFTLNSPSGFTSVDGVAMNASGIVAGNASKAAVIPRPFVWQPSGGSHLLPVRASLPGQTLTYTARGMNDAGDVVGNVLEDDSGAGGDVFSDGVLWPAAGGAPQEIGGDRLLTDINNCVEKSGFQFAGVPDEAVFFFPNNDERELSFELPSGGGADFLASDAYALDNLGWVAGSADDFDTGQLHAFLWRPDGGTPVELAPLSGDVQAVAEDVNDDGLAVGYSMSSDGTSRAVAWKVSAASFGGTMDLYIHHIAQLESDGTLSSAQAANLTSLLGMAKSQAALGHVAPAQSALAMVSSQVATLRSSGTLSVRQAHLLGDGAVCAGRALTS